MSFLSKIRDMILRLLGASEKKEGQKTQEHVALANLMQHLKEKNSIELAEIDSESEKFKERLTAVFSDLRYAIERLKAVKGGDAFSKASVQVKNNFCDKALKIVSSAPEKSLQRKDFIARTKIMLEEINSVTPRQAAHMGFFFRDHLDAIAAKIKSIKEIISDFEEFIETSILSDIENIARDIAEIRENEKKMGYFERNISELDAEIGNMKAKESRKHSRIPVADKSATASLSEKMEELMKEKGLIEQEIDTEFGAISKIMKKYSHLKKDKKIAKIIDKYTESPSDAFLKQDKSLEIKNLISGMKKELESEAIEADEKKYIHVCSLLSNMQNFRKTREKYNKILGRICEIETELMKEEKQLEKIKKAESEVAEIRNKINDITAMKRQLEESRKKVRESSEQKARDMEFRVSSSMGLEIIIDF